MMQYTIFGRGYLGDKMGERSINISLTSTGYKILSIIIIIFLSWLNYFLIKYIRQIPWPALVFSMVVLLFCIFGSYLCFNHKIIFNHKKKLFIFCNLVQKRVMIDDIVSILVSTDNSLNHKRYCAIHVNLKNGEKIILAGFTSIIPNNSVAITRNKIKQLSESIPSIKFIY